LIFQCFDAGLSGSSDSRISSSALAAPPSSTICWRASPIFRVASPDLKIGLSGEKKIQNDVNFFKNKKKAQCQFFSKKKKKKADQSALPVSLLFLEAAVVVTIIVFVTQRGSISNSSSSKVRGAVFSALKFLNLFVDLLNLPVLLNAKEGVCLLLE
jgi:hypothetical protein